ncbi:MAG: aminoglycoside adenylyltransferase domain-containing protein [Thermomicrobiales bacterium]
MSNEKALSPTPYPDVNAALCDLLSGVRAILGDQFCGMYLSGSLALGDFAPYSSDIDIVVVTDADLSDDLFAALRAMHAHFNISDSPWATEVEAAYLPLRALRRDDPAHACFPHIERGADERLKWDRFDSGWVIQRFILREHGIIVTGPALPALIDPVQSDDLRRTVSALMETWWGPMRGDPGLLHRQHIGYQAYTVLTMCRMLYTLDFGTVVSKPVAARWAQEILDERWAALIERALMWRKDCQGTLSHRDMDETLALIQYTLERCHRVTRLPQTD